MLFVGFLVLFIGSSIAWGYNTEERIVGGQVAPDGAYPHMVAILQTEYNSLVCGGSILNHQWVLTAAHCAGRTPSLYSVRAGSNNWSKGGQTRQVLQIIKHQDHDPFFNYNDVALLRVEPITFGEKVQPIPLESQRVEPDVYTQVSGWGLLSYPGKTPTDLHHITLKVVYDDFRCKDSIEFCTLNKAGEGICSGDSGSPSIKQVGNAFKQIGIASKSGWLCAKGVPDIFARVSVYIPWIQAHCDNCAST